MKCFYELHANRIFEKSIQYAVGFEGYINTLCGVHEHLENKNIVLSKFTTEEPTHIQQLYYPAYVDTTHVKNNCDLSNNMIISGINASGKTTMLKSVTINVIFSQQFGCGFYEKCVINPYTHIHSYLNIPDTSGRDSLFQAEARRCKEIITKIHDAPPNARHFCIFDELYSGTNPVEASKSAYAFLLYLSKYKNVDFMLTTHYVSVCKKLEKKLAAVSVKYRGISNHKMIVTDNPTKYTYKMKRGISKKHGAIIILEELEYPEEILNIIRSMKE